jgi:hypothetical protein
MNGTGNQPQNRAPYDMPAAEQLAELPLWAQKHITWLTRRALADDEYTEQLSMQLIRQEAELENGPANSNVLIRHGERPDRPLGINTPVTFRLRTQDFPDGRITVRHGLGVIEVRCADGALHITPESSNVIRIRIGTY